MIERPLYKSIWDRLSGDKHMIFLSGPRQSGKTTLGRMIAEGYSNNLYFNGDVSRNKSRLVNDPFV